MKIPWRPILTVLVLVAIGFGVYAGVATRKPSAPKYESVRAERGHIVARVTATGTLSALVTVQVGAQVSGRIYALNADFNSRVQRGQTIARIDPQLFEAAVVSARANLLAADGSLAKSRAQSLDAERQLQRNRALRDQKFIAQADFDTAQANADVARAQIKASQGAVEQARAALHQALINLDYTTIKSPIDGMVISRNVDVGQTVAAALQAPTLFTIAEDLQKMQVDTNVAEGDVGKLKPGATATFTVDAYPSERFTGVVRQIRNAPQSIQNVVTYDAVIDVRNPELRLKPGMTANVTFIYAEKDDALRVSNAALRFRPPPELLPPSTDGGAGGQKKPRKGEGPSDRRTLWVLQGGKPTQVPVRIGISDGTVTELVEGEVKPGDLLVTDVSSADGKAASTPGAAVGGAPMRRMF